MAIQEQVPTTDGVTYLEFSLSDTTYPFVAASTVGSAEVMLEEIIPRGDAGYAEFFSVIGTDPAEVKALAEEHPSVEAHLINGFDGGTLFEFLVSDNCPAVYLGEEGALPRKVESKNGDGIVAAEVPASEDAASIADRFLDHHPDAELLVKRRQPYETPMFSQRHLQHELEEQLTERQQEVLVAAHESGYYNWPRDTTGEAIADDLGLSTPTFHQHLRAAEQKLVSISLG